MSTGYTAHTSEASTHNHAALEHLGETLFDTNCPYLSSGGCTIAIAIVAAAAVTVAFHLYD
jgi:hypothetical protein